MPPMLPPVPGASGETAPIVLSKALSQEPSQAYKKVTNKDLQMLRILLATMKTEASSLQLLRRGHDDRVMDERLQTTREEVEMRLERCKEMKHHYLAKKAELKRLVQDNDQFIRSTDAKVSAAERRVKEERAELKRLNEEFARLEQELKVLKHQKTVESSKLGGIQQVRAFLKSVADIDFDSDTDAVLRRRKTLDTVFADLSKRESALEEESAQLQQELSRTQARVQNDLLRCSTEVHEAQVQLESWRGTRMDVEQNLHRARVAQQAREQERELVATTTGQLLRRMIETCRLDQRRQSLQALLDSKYLQSDRRLDQQLAIIKERMNELAYISRISGQRVAEYLEQNPEQVHVAPVAGSVEWSQVPGSNEY